MEAGKDGSIRIEQTVFVARDGQKAIVLGKGGQSIKEIGARRGLTGRGISVSGAFVYFRQVRKNWQDDPERYRVLGLDYGA